MVLLHNSTNTNEFFLWSLFSGLACSQDHSEVVSFHVNPGFPILLYSLLQEVDHLDLHNDSTNESIIAPDGRSFPCCGFLLRNPCLELSVSLEAFLEGTPALDTLSQGFFQVRVGGVYTA